MPPERLLVKPSDGGFDFSCGNDFRLRILTPDNGAFHPDGRSPAIFAVLSGSAEIAADGASAIARRGSVWYSRPGIENASILPSGNGAMVAWAEA